MNINYQLFNDITENLNTVLDTVLDHQKTRTRKYEYYAMDFCMAALMSYYECPDGEKKNPQMLLEAIFNGGIYIRFICDNSEDFKERQELVYKFLEDYDIWNDGWLDGLLTSDEDRKNIEISRELTIEETRYLTYQKMKIEIDDNGRLKDMVTILIAIFLFASRIKVDFTRETVSVP